jgi:hypothetical protein
MHVVPRHFRRSSLSLVIDEACRQKKILHTSCFQQFALEGKPSSNIGQAYGYRSDRQSIGRQPSTETRVVCRASRSIRHSVIRLSFLRKTLLISKKNGAIPFSPHQSIWWIVRSLSNYFRTKSQLNRLSLGNWANTYLFEEAIQILEQFESDAWIPTIKFCGVPYLVNQPRNGLIAMDFRP